MSKMPKFCWDEWENAARWDHLLGKFLQYFYQSLSKVAIHSGVLSDCAAQLHYRHQSGTQLKTFERAQQAGSAPPANIVPLFYVNCTVASTVTHERKTRDSRDEHSGFQGRSYVPEAFSTRCATTVSPSYGLLLPNTTYPLLFPTFSSA